jgi:hypothetical protein
VAVGELLKQFEGVLLEAGLVSLALDEGCVAPDLA